MATQYWATFSGRGIGRSLWEHRGGNKNHHLETSLVVLWLRLCASNAGGVGLTPSEGPKIPYAMWHSQKKKNTQNENKTMKQNYHHHQPPGRCRVCKTWVYSIQPTSFFPTFKSAGCHADSLIANRQGMEFLMRQLGKGDKEKEEFVF